MSRRSLDRGKEREGEGGGNSFPGWGASLAAAGEGGSRCRHCQVRVSLFTALISAPYFASLGPMLFSRHMPTAALVCYCNKETHCTVLRDPAPEDLACKLEQQRMTAEIVSSCGKDSRPCRAGKHHFVLQGLCPVALRWEVRECVFTCLCVIFLCFGQVRCPRGSGMRRSEGTHLTQACRSPGRVKAVLGFQLPLLPCKKHVPLMLRKHHLLFVYPCGL